MILKICINSFKKSPKLRPDFSLQVHLTARLHLNPGILEQENNDLVKVVDENKLLLHNSICIGYKFLFQFVRASSLPSSMSENKDIQHSLGNI